MSNFNRPDTEPFLKTLWEKEQMLVTSIFSFSHTMFSNTSEKSHKPTYTENCHLQNAFNLSKVKILSTGQGLLHNPESLSLFILWLVCPGFVHHILSFCVFFKLLIPYFGSLILDKHALVVPPITLPQS